jgi:carbon storage regulator
VLCLSRRPGEKIVIDTPQGQVVITVLDWDRGAVKLGLDDPRSIAIYRAEMMPKGTPKPEASQ